MENKTKTVNKWKIPINIKEVESFLEFANFYRCFIKNFSYIVKPLNELKCKKDWKQEEKYQKTFDKLKEKITSQLVHALSKRKENFRVETNVLEHIIEEVPFQEQEEKWKPIIFLSRCHILSLTKQSILYHSDTALSISKLQACLLQWPPSLQHALIVVVQQSRYSIFYDRDTPIQLGLLQQSCTPVSISILKPLLGTIEVILMKP